MNTELFLGPLAAFMAAFTWAIAVGTYALLARSHAASKINATRAVVALPFTIILAAWQSGGPLALLRDLTQVPLSTVWWFVGSIFSGYAFGDVIFLHATRLIGPPSALAIASIYPFWSAIFGLIFLDQELTVLKITGLTTTIAGTAIVIMAGKKAFADPERQPRQYWAGVGFAFLTSIFWAFNAFATGIGGKGVSLGMGTMIRMTIALILCPIIGKVLLRQQMGFVPLRDLKKYWPNFVSEGFLGSIFYLYGLSHSSVAVGAAMSSLSPVISAPWAWLKRWERFDLTKFIGIIVVVIGLTLLVMP